MRCVLPLAVLGGLAACQQTEAPPGQSYFDRVIQPILVQSCSRGTGGCHRVDSADPFAFAAGNLDVTSFESLHKRPDVLRTFGAYPAPFLLLKAAGETTDLTITYRGQALPSKVPHAGGPILHVGDPAFLTLQTWLDNGATRDGVRPAPAPVAGSGPCSMSVPVEFDEAALTATAKWRGFSGELDGVQAVMDRAGCGSANCHGAPQSDFYITCGSDARQRAFNFSQVWAFTADPVDSSEILRRPVAGGGPHTGGAYFTSIDDPAYRTVAKLAAELGALPFGEGDAARTFFADRVMPILLERGCAAEGCHSPAAMNDLKLRSGSNGSFPKVALEKNYDSIKTELMAFEVPDVRRGRLVAKNLLPANGGLAHRGGPLLETGGGAGPEVVCKSPYDAATASPYCTFVEWARLERLLLGNPNAGKVKIVYVARDPGTMAPSLLDFAAYQPGGDLRVFDLGPDGTNAGGDASLLGGCGVAAAQADVRAPDVRNDGQTVAFALRRSASDTLHLYTVGIDGKDCRAFTSDAGVYDLDPAWSPDGQWVVFASTRAGGTTRRLGLPQSDLWRVKADGSAAERLTYLSNSEIGPQFKRDGRITMTTEKVDVRDPQGGFYQLSGRRLNWDQTDYHPLLGQRQRSPVDPSNPQVLLPSIGFSQVTEIREGLDGDFLLIGSEPGAPATAGTLLEFNRSIGPFEQGRTDPGYLQSATIYPTAGGVYRSPSLLPDGRVLCSYAAGGLAFDLVALDRVTKTQTVLVASGGVARVEATLALAYPPRPLYLNRRQLVFGGQGKSGDLAHAQIYVPDAPMIGTLLGANLRRGRNVAALRGADHLAVWGPDGSLVGTAPLASDGSVRVRAPSGVPVYLGLMKGSSTLLQMSEEHQFGPGEQISLGVPEKQFNHVCGGCHGSVSGKETDVAVSADALTGASESLSLRADPVAIGP